MIRFIILKERILVNKPASVTIRELKIVSIFIRKLVLKCISLSSYPVEQFLIGLCVVLIQVLVACRLL
jgi:hypothetical protein